MNPYLYRNETLEAIARKAISQYDPCLLRMPAPIPVEIIIEKTYGLTLEFQFIRKNGQVLGETVFEDAMTPIYEHKGGYGYKLIPVKGGTVIIDASLLTCQDDSRFRFTCAHELAHWLIHKKFYTKLHKTAAMTNVTRSSESDEIIEWQANRLGSYLLMPKGTVKMAFHSNRDKDSNVITLLAEQFGVSHKTMEIRLTEIGLVQ